VTLAEVAAIVYAVVTAGVVAFQIALALGAPWGAYAMGGAFPGRFPPAMRIAAIVQAALLALMALVVLARAGLVLPAWARASAWLVWVVVGITAFAVVLNTITPSGGERRIWAPVTLVMLGCSLTVALAAG